MREIRPILLLGMNFVREQRWPLLVLLIWVLGLAFLGLSLDLQQVREREDVLLVFKYMAVYGVAFSVFFGGSALYNERRSRRILGVLAKSVSRQAYISGLLLGVAMASGLYCFVLAFTGSWVLGGIGFPLAQLWYMMTGIFAACMLAASLAVLFSTFLNPWLAAALTALGITLPMALSQILGSPWSYLLPVSALVELLLKSSFHPSTILSWVPLEVAGAEVVLLWLAAGLVFRRTDIAVAVE
jgi:hypothetical protein